MQRSQRRSRTVGRVQVALLEIDFRSSDYGVLAGQATGADHRLEISVQGGDDLELVACGLDGSRLGSLRVTGRGHADSFYGAVSAADSSHAYGSRLFVEPVARRRGIGEFLVRSGVAEARQRWSLGYKTLIDTSNTSSVALHERVGLSIRRECRGIRLGSRVVWLTQRNLQA